MWSGKSPGAAPSSNASYPSSMSMTVDTQSGRSPTGRPANSTFVPESSSA